MTGRYLIIRADALVSDSWTYGDWHQYRAFCDNGECLIVRMSELPRLAALLGLCFLLVAGIAAWAGFTALDAAVNWWRLFVLAFIGFAMTGPAFVVNLTGWRLTVIVGTTTRKGDGKWQRDL